MTSATDQYEIKVYKALARSYYEQKLRELLQNENIEEHYIDAQTEILKKGLLYEYKRCEKQEKNLNFDIDEVNKFHAKMAALYCKRFGDIIQQFPGPLSKLRGIELNKLKVNNVDIEYLVEYFAQLDTAGIGKVTLLNSEDIFDEILNLKHHNFNADDTRLFKFPFPSYFNDGLEWLENNRNKYTQENDVENLLSSFRIDELCKMSKKAILKS
ncbi:hypothetical protein O9G_002861 [Rozella allomycis CSF55]|uniref:Uncharacterized protein n=1 Tax=Rozella allomycis (strain CSF55) TaxID=988480 RepID=A0A075ASA2_ROZAC|nr:hypothetical protein O9G_002861 [Rozella allomycis CSF55]|eukprot:EPZ33060.1 hypothetical protein O9G_002861 [Rozella allomycis CSF55]